MHTRVTIAVAAVFVRLRVTHKGGAFVKISAGATFEWVLKEPRASNIRVLVDNTHPRPPPQTTTLKLSVFLRKIHLPQTLSDTKPRNRPLIQRRCLVRINSMMLSSYKACIAYLVHYTYFEPAAKRNGIL